jgi:hypothetical protein
MSIGCSIRHGFFLSKRLFEKEKKEREKKKERGNTAEGSYLCTHSDVIRTNCITCLNLKILSHSIIVVVFFFFFFFFLII